MPSIKPTSSLTKPQLRAGCTRFLSGHVPQSQSEWLQKLAASSVASLQMDQYSEGPAIQQLEQEVAELLGKEAAIFVNKGVIAQLAALRIWADRTKVSSVALHPQSHIATDERNAYERLQGLTGVLVGQDYQPITLTELQNLHEPLGVITIELPLRRAGYKLPSWKKLAGISDWAASQSIPLHFDGARLWESANFYGRSYAEIAALADSVYVSFYKGLGGMAGCVLAGSANFIEEAKIWRNRLGGDLYTVFPYVIAAIEGLHHHLPKMEAYCLHAQRLAAALAEIPGVVISPDPPHTNAFQIYLPNSAPALRAAAFEIAQTEGIWLFGMLESTAIPNFTMGEITVGEATEQWQISEIVAVMQRLLTLSHDSA